MAAVLIEPTTYSVTPTAFATGVPKAVQSAYNAGRIPPDVPISRFLESQDSGALAFIYFFIIFATLLVLLRLFSRSFLANFTGPDDWLAALTIPFYVAFGALCIILIKIGSGRHIEWIQYVMDQPMNSYSERLDFYAHLLYTTALWICRLSGLAFYHRLCRNIPRMGVAIWSTVAFVTAGFIVQFLLILLHCLPVTDLWPYVWQPEVLNYTCMLWQVIYTTNSAISLLSDILIFTIPAWVIASLKGTDSSIRIKLILILCPGVLTTIVSIARLVFVIISGFDAADQSWLYSPLLAIEVAEMGTTMIALSAPGINLFFHRVTGKGPSFRSTRGGDTSKSRSGGSVPMYHYSRDTKVRVDRIGRERLAGQLSPELPPRHHPSALVEDGTDPAKLAELDRAASPHSATPFANGIYVQGARSDAEHGPDSEKGLYEDDDDDEEPYFYNATRSRH
ncbi:uncharacterized protein PFL1_05674 [Pseudozyma flocculosa PF-1]|uniref:Rhodopsin domain-containing protein n=2 Tax=Pseudozyma flocculosa TaxID=84751 RepID=A0A5C3FA62_9BASI|nr:uncharacterized protein PFL1_05674 [Pseudozyma flocculosa PF-1]EPQ26695.1 hypothetical protein PFL1_05674 [Pseudozyma flocculosa PF-1]SPO40986.1 uncharacterized protein PSFLO_06468 [Pseudozyma flocculosa]